MRNIQLRGIAAVVTGALLFSATPFVMADSTDDLLKKLRDKGVLSEQEYDDFNSTRDTEKAKKSSEIKASFKDGISWQSGDGSTKMSVSGRIQADYRDFDTPSQTSSGNTADTFDIRRAYLGVKGTFYNSINFELTTDLASGTNTNNGYIKYGWLEAAWWEQAKVRFGQFKSPFGLEQNTSSRFIDFTERDWGASLAPGVDRGVMLHGVPIKGMYYGVSAMNGGYLADYGQNRDEPNSKYDGKEFSGRVTANIAQLATIDNMILHIGGDYSKGNNLPNIVGGTNALSFRTNGRGSEFFKTNGTYNNPDVQRQGLEGIVAYGPVKIQSEWYKLKLEPSDSPIKGKTPTTSLNGDKSIKTWYAEAMWLITGEKYADFYKDGLMDRIRPKNDFIAPGAPGWGAWEVGMRYSKFDADDFESGVDYNVGATGKNNYTNGAHSWTAGLKWIPNPNTRFMLDYIDTSFDDEITAGGNTNNGVAIKPYDSERAINLRAQFDF
jgi:phosphate-selective porin OprO and OprP